MAILLSLNDIDDVLLHLSYANPTAQKYRLIQSIRQCYGGSDPAAFPSAIDAAVLVKALWDTGNDHILIKNKRKNLSSLKSAVNGDLKRLYKDGVISQGIIINRHNTFDLSDEAKNDTLSTLARNLGAEKEDVKGMSAKITEVLTIIRQVLSAQDVLSGKGNVGGLHDMEEVKQLLQYLSRQIDGIEGGITGATNAHTQTNDGGLLASSAARSVDAAGSSNAPIDDSAAIHAAGLGVTTFGPASTDNSSHLETGAPVSEDTSQILSDLAGIASPAPAQTSASGPETGSATFADAGTPTEQDFDTEAVLEAVEAEEEDLVENIIEDTNLEMAPVSSSGAPLEAFATEESTGLDGEVAGTGGPESNILNHYCPNVEF